MREEYRVYYENYEELAQEEPGAEIPLQKDIVWENKNSQSERWKALSVFACSQGLVLELAKQVAVRVWLYASPTLPSGRLDVVMLGAAAAFSLMVK